MTGWKNIKSRICAGTFAAALACGLSACGGSDTTGEFRVDDAGRELARSVSLEQAIAELEAQPVPVDVEPLDWQELQQALKDSLLQQGIERFTSAAPQSQASAVMDLVITHNQDGSADLSWTYANQGDGDLNSEVNIADLTPLGIHLGKTSQSADWFRARNTDNDRNTVVNISDITPIGSNFLNKVQGYWVQRSTDPDGSWNAVTQVEFNTSSINQENAQREFSYRLSEPGDGIYYRVAPYESGLIGIPSNFVQADTFVLPGKPGNEMATQGTVQDAVELSWSGVTGAEYYEIQRRVGTSGSFAHLADTADSSTAYTDENVVTGERYTYIVRAWQGDTKSSFSNQFQGWPMELPLTPTGLEASDGTSEAHVELSWDPVVGVDEYVIYHSLDENGTYAELARTDQTSYQDTAAAAAVLNWYYITASNPVGESPQSARDSGFLGGSLPVVDSVSPLEGLNGEVLQMTATTSGSTPLGWSWDFGGGATPGTSTDESPQITLGAPGVYDCSLTVEGNLGNDVFDFQLTVLLDEWVHTLGGASADEGFSVGADSDGNTYLIGQSGMPVVAKFDVTGNLLWSKRYDTSLDQQWISGAVTSTGDVVLAAAKGENDATTSGTGVLILRLDKDGNQLFAKVYESGATLVLTRYPRVAVDSSGNAFIAFTAHDLLNLTGTLYCMEMTPAGTITWVGHYDTPSDYDHDDSVADGIAVDSAGNMYIGADEANVVKLNGTGGVEYCKGWGDIAGTPHEHAYTMAVDSSDNLYLAGGANNLSEYQPFVIKFDQSGSIAWQKAFSSGAGTTSAQIVQLRIDSGGTVYALNPQREDASESSKFFILGSDGVLQGSWEYSSAGRAKLFALEYLAGKLMFTGTAPDNTDAWSVISDNTLSDYSLSIEDRAVSVLVASGNLVDATGLLVDYAGTLDTGAGAADMLVMNLRPESLP